MKRPAGILLFLFPVWASAQQPGTGPVVLTLDSTTTDSTSSGKIKGPHNTVIMIRRECLRDLRSMPRVAIYSQCVRPILRHKRTKRYKPGLLPAGL